MATTSFRGDAQAGTGQITTLTVGGTLGSGDTVSVTINRKVVTIEVTAGDTAATASALQVALASSTDAEFTEVTWTYPGTGAVVTGTSTTAEVPFTLTTGVTGTTTLTAATTSGSDQKGPSHFDDPNNFTGGSLPTNSDIVVFPPQELSCFYGLDALSAVSLAELRIEGGTIGLPDRNVAGYVEYRVKDLTLAGCTALNIRGNVTRARVKVTSGSVAAKIDAGAGFAFAGTADPAIRITGAATYTTLAVTSGDVGVSYTAGETTTVSLLTVGTFPTDNSIGSSDSDGRVRIGMGATVTAATVNGGIVETQASGTNLTITGGTWRQITGNLGTVTSTGGTIDYRSTGSIGNATFTGPDAVLDLSGATGAVTIGTLSFTGGARLIDPHKRISSLSVAMDAQSLAISDLGRTFTLARS